MEKRTDKHRRKTYGSYYSEFERWDIRGKSSKEVREMFVDLKNCLYYNLSRIKKLKFIIEEFKKDGSKANQLKRQKEISKDKQSLLVTTRLRLERTLEREKNLKSELKNLKKQLKKEEAENFKLTNNMNDLKKQLTSLKIKKNRAVVKKVDKPYTKEQLKIKRILESGAEEKHIRNLEYVVRTNKFLKQNSLTLNFFEVLTKAEVLGMLKSKDEGITYKVLERLSDLGFLNISTAIKGATKYWYLSQKGKDLINDYRNYLSYGR